MLSARSADAAFGTKITHMTPARDSRDECLCRIVDLPQPDRFRIRSVGRTTPCTIAPC
jgi:hypothetical protein